MWDAQTYISPFSENDQVTRFFEILLKVQNRVSTNKPTSNGSELLPQTAAIDKINGKLLRPIPLDEIRRRLQLKGVESRLKTLRNRRWHLEVGSAEFGIYLPLSGPIGNCVVTGLVSRPSAFANMTKYETLLSKIFSSEEIGELKIGRVDFALDYRIEIATVIRGLDVKFKRITMRFLDNCGRRTGLEIGSGRERIVVYDKARLEKESTPRTRLEVQLSGNSVPFRTFDQLRHFDAAKFSDPVLQKIQLSQVQLLPNLPSTLGKRSKILETILDRDGFLAARKELNTNQNFGRDYANLLDRNNWPEQPAQSFSKLIQTFFKEEGEQI